MQEQAVDPYAYLRAIPLVQTPFNRQAAAAPPSGIEEPTRGAPTTRPPDLIAAPLVRQPQTTNIEVAASAPAARSVPHAACAPLDCKATMLDGGGFALACLPRQETSPATATEASDRACTIYLYDDGIVLDCAF